MLQVASAAGDSMPCLLLQAHDNDATPQLVRRLSSWTPPACPPVCLPLVCLCVDITCCARQQADSGWLASRAVSCRSAPCAPPCLRTTTPLVCIAACLPACLPACPSRRPQAEEIGEACSQLAVKLPVAYTLRPGAALYQAVVQTAQQPELAIPETPSLKVGGWVVGSLSESLGGFVAGWLCNVQCGVVWALVWQGGGCDGRRHGRSGPGTGCLQLLKSCAERNQVL